MLQRLGQVAGFADRKQTGRRTGDYGADLSENAESNQYGHYISEPWGAYGCP